MRKDKHPQWQLGTVHWFDEKSGEGIIKSETGENFYVHYSAIESNRKWKSLKSKKKVRFQLVDDISLTQVLKVKEI